jgi:NAD(P)-dependent dehydrogenase (short-subunit alcohol dehydrogenase family)
MMTIAVVGAGRGLGAAVARRFGSEGFDVALLSRSHERVDALAGELAAGGVTAQGYAADVRDTAALSAALGRAAETLGPVEVLFDVPAGISDADTFHALPQDVPEPGRRGGPQVDEPGRTGAVGPRRPQRHRRSPGPRCGISPRSRC